MAAGTINYAGTLTVIECGSCHIKFAIPQQMQREVAINGDFFYCPRGCHIHYFEDEHTRLKAQLDQAKADAVWQANRRHDAEVEADAARRSAAAYKGHLTRARNRIANGVCPVPACKRSGFTQVARHIETCHPEWAEAHPEALTTDP